MADKGSSHKLRVANRGPTHAFVVFHRDALEEVASSMERGEQLCAFLDDIYVLCAPHRVVPLFKQLSESLERVAGSDFTKGKLGSGTQEGSLRGTLGSHTGSKFSGPLWAPELSPPKSCVSEWQRKSNCGTLSQLLLHSANPRANHILRTLPPSLSSDYAQEHDDGVWETVVVLLQQVSGGQEERALTTLPMRMGGLGGIGNPLRCPCLLGIVADALPMVGQRNPEVAETVVRTMEGEQPQLDREGFCWWRTGWPELHHGKRPPESTTGEPAWLAV